MTWQRARNKDQIEQRKQSLMEAASRLMDEVGFEKVSLRSISKEVGITTAGTYRYFESKEAIYLELLTEDLTEWVNSLEKQLAGYADSGDVESVAAILAKSVKERPRMAVLLSILTSILEKNLTLETLAGYKRQFMELWLRLGNSIHVIFPPLTMEHVRSFLYQVIITMNGLWPIAHPSDIVREIHKQPEFAPLELDFETELQKYICVILKGLTTA
ncbi:MAG: TetR/AcrR family transcriptional regulator [Proteobacteria bacterium]|nr:TetR/AcrR family transcriptional regulator [Pseudomonadota bacterium]